MKNYNMIIFSKEEFLCGGNAKIIILGIIIISILIIIVYVKSTNIDPAIKGVRGEKQVENILQELPNEYYIINHIMVPTQNGTSQIDHIVVSTYGVFVIETKNYTGWIFGSNNSRKWKEIFKTESHYFYNPIKQNWAHIYALSECLNLNKWIFKSIVVFSDDASLNVESTTPVIYMSELKKHILSYTQEIFSAEEAAKIYNNINGINLAGTDIGSRHNQIVRDNLEKQKKEIDQGKCPRCDGRLVLRIGKYGQFYGCSNYPKCRFTQDI